MPTWAQKHMGGYDYVILIESDNGTLAVVEESDDLEEMEECIKSMREQNHHVTYFLVKVMP